MIDNDIDTAGTASERLETFVVAVNGTDCLGVEALSEQFVRVATVGVGEWGALRDMVARLDTVADGSSGDRASPPLRVVIDTQRDAREAVRRLGWPHRQRLSEAVAQRAVVVGFGTVPYTAQTSGVGVDGRERVARRVVDPGAWVLTEGRYNPVFGYKGEIDPTASPESLVEETLAAAATPAEVRETFETARDRRWWAPHGMPAALLAAWGFARAGADAKRATEWAREAGLADAATVETLYSALTTSSLELHHKDDAVPSVLDRFASMVFSLSNGDGSDAGSTTES